MNTCIIVYFSFDRWAIVQRYGYRESLIGFRATREEALELAARYQALEGR
jgi:hypothetical protein